MNLFSRRISKLLLSDFIHLHGKRLTLALFPAQLENRHVFCDRLYCDRRIDAIDEVLKKSDKSKTIEVPKITLLDLNSNISITTLEHAEKIAHNNNLKLVQVHDNTLKSKRPVYQLMTKAQFLNEDLKAKTNASESKKGQGVTKKEKSIAITSKIAGRDLETKVKQTMKLVEKKYEVRIIISGDANNKTLAENIFSKFEEAAAGVCRIVQKRWKDCNLKFQVIPDKEEKSKKKTTSNTDTCK